MNRHSPLQAPMCPIYLHSGVEKKNRSNCRTSVVESSASRRCDPGYEREEFSRSSFAKRSPSSSLLLRNGCTSERKKRERERPNFYKLPSIGKYLELFLRSRRENTDLNPFELRVNCQKHNSIQSPFSTSNVCFFFINEFFINFSL